MKVAILTLFYGNYNYGGVLQGYALKNYISGIEGNNVEILKYQDWHNPIYSSKKEQIKQYGLRSFFSKAFEKILEKFTFLIEGRLSARRRKFEEFVDEYSSEKLYSDETIAGSCNKYDCFISGSDQVWNPNCIRNGFLQKFVTDDKVKASYAASIGRERLTDREANIIADEINKFDFISVREESAKKIFSEKVQKDISLVLDPVFLLEKEQWNAKAKNVERPYVLCYFFSDSRKIRKAIQKKYGKEMEILFIPYAKHKLNLYDFFGPGKRVNDAGPKDFVDLIANAKCIYTDSFHGTAFSIIFGKPFYVFRRDNSKKQTSMNSRLYNVLKMFGLEERMIEPNVICNGITKPDYSKVHGILEQKKKEAKDFLSEVLDTRK